MRRTRNGLDDFYGGYSAALSVALYGDDGTATRYLEAIGAVDWCGLLDWAERNDDIELPRIREAIAFLRKQGRLTPKQRRRPRRHVRGAA